MCDCVPPEFFDERTVTARKRHVCCECGYGIMPGVRHRKVAGKWDGDFSEFRQCPSCAQAFDDLAGVVRDCICYGTLRDELVELNR